MCQFKWDVLYMELHTHDSSSNSNPCFVIITQEVVCCTKHQGEAVLHVELLFFLMSIF